MFYGNKYFKPIVGEHSKSAGGKFTLPSGVTLCRAGTFLRYKTSSQEEFDLCENGKGLIGWMTQGMDANGLTMENFAVVGNTNINLRSGQEVSLRIPEVGNEYEIEGAGVAGGGNLVVTSGTGAIASNTARYTLLAVHKGGLRVAQAGDVASFELVAADLTPLADDANVRIHVRYTGGAYVIPTPTP